LPLSSLSHSVCPSLGIRVVCLQYSFYSDRRRAPYRHGESDRGSGSNGAARRLPGPLSPPPRTRRPGRHTRRSRRCAAAGETGTQRPSPGGRSSPTTVAATAT
ncbi:unnamed protein product, partial [Ectocarpus sp. 13 AM-2016]